MVSLIHKNTITTNLDGPTNVFISNNYAYISSYNNDSLVIFDIINPILPTYVGSIQGAGAPNYLDGITKTKIVGDYAYVVSWKDNAFSIFDISNPAAPVHVGVISGAGAPNYLYNASGVDIVGNYAYVVSNYDGALSIFDISNTAVPILKGLIQGFGEPNYLDGANAINVVGNYAYIVCTWDASLTIINISNPTTPTHVSSIIGAGAPNYLDFAYDIKIIGNYAYVVSEEDAALTIFDISNPANPVHVGVITGFGAPNFLGYVESVDISGDYACVASNYDNALSIFNISNPTNPVLEDSIQGIGAPNYLKGANGVFISGNYAYVTSWGDNSLSIFEISGLLPTTIISGNIKDSFGNNIQDVNIEFIGTNIYETSTDKNGNYLYNVEPDTYTMVLSKEGYNDINITITITDLDISRDFVLQPLGIETTFINRDKICWISDDIWWMSFCSSWQMYAGRAEVGYAGAWYTWRTLLHFDLASILDKDIVSIKLYLYVNDYTYNWVNSSELIIKKITSDWVEPTWDNQPTTTDLNQLTFPTGLEPAWYSIDVTQLIFDMLNSSNYGLELVESGNNNRVEINNELSNPYLEISYNALQSTYTIFGITFDDNNNILPNTTIQINDQQITTDENGYYSIITEPGIYDMVASKEGYIEDFVIIEVIDSDLIQDFILTKIEEECPECPVCPDCPPDKLDWWLLLIGGALGHILKKNDKKEKK